jgi:hypothetical protein
MPYVCKACNHFEAENAHASGCPCCGGAMRFTMLDPHATATATLDAPSPEKWEDPFVYGYEEVEAPWSARYAQIGAGIVVYFIAARVSRFLALGLVGQALDQLSREALIVVGFGLIVLDCLAAVLGGMVAGFWARNWVPQGLGVAAGVFAIPLLLVLIFVPQFWILFLLGLVFTSVFTVLGAYLGHRLVKPTRIPKS